MQVSWLGRHGTFRLPGLMTSDMLKGTLSLQWRDRAGLSPASLFTGFPAGHEPRIQFYLMYPVF